MGNWSDDWINAIFQPKPKAIVRHEDELRGFTLNSQINNNDEMN